MLQDFEEINYSFILDKAGLLRNEFKDEEIPFILYDGEVKSLLEQLLENDNDYLGTEKNLSKKELNQEYIDIHKLFIKRILFLKTKAEDNELKKVIEKNQIEFRVHHLLRKSDVSYIINKYFETEVINDTLLEKCSNDYALNYMNHYILEKYNDSKIPNALRNNYINRINEIEKYM